MLQDLRIGKKLFFHYGGFEEEELTFKGDEKMKKIKKYVVRFGLFIALLAVASSVMAFTTAPLTIGGCKEGPYDWDAQRPGGNDGGECQNAYGEPAVADCCCFVASASGLDHGQISTLRTVRNWMLSVIPGFDKVNYLYHTVVGPETANYLRAHPVARNLSHGWLTITSGVFSLFGVR